MLSTGATVVQEQQLLQTPTWSLGGRIRLIMLVPLPRAASRALINCEEQHKACQHPLLLPAADSSNSQTNII
jgi:hypothetical protein